MLKGWRFLGKVGNILMYQQNKRYVGVIVSTQETPVKPLGPGIYAPEIVKLDFEIIEPQVPAPYVPYDVWVSFKKIVDGIEAIATPYWSTVSWNPYSLTPYGLPTPDDVVVHMNTGDEVLAYIIVAPESCNVLFEPILAPANIPKVPSSVSISLTEKDTIIKLPRISCPDRITVALSEIVTEPVVQEYSDYPVIDSQYSVDIEGRGTPHDTYS